MAKDSAPHLPVKNSADPDHFCYAEVTMRICLVEDQEKLLQILKRGLELEGFAVDAYMDGEKAFQHLLMNHEDYDIVILDIMLPGKDGMEICKALRDRNIQLPIIFLTAKNEVQDVVNGLNLGADDYIAKPFIFEELLARVRTLLRRPANLLAPHLINDGLELDSAARIASLDGEEIALTSKEFALLEHFLRHPNQLFGREQLLSSLWDMSFDSFSNVVDVHVKNLRKKLGAWAQHHLETVYAEGYRYRE